MGVIYVGPRDDYGYNQAQAQAAAAIKKMPGGTVVEQEKVPETTDVQKTMGSMIEQDGATLLFPTSFGYFDPHTLKLAEKYPKVRFAHCGGLWAEGKHPKNVGSYFGYTLSGGNVQRAVLARELSEAVSVLIAANPVFGLDFAAVAEIHDRILAARNAGAAVLLISEDLDELLELSDRIAVMFDGRIVHETPVAQADIAVIGRCMAGHHLAAPADLARKPERAHA